MTLKDLDIYANKKSDTNNRFHLFGDFIVKSKP